jgi:hypothetical protein
MRRRGSEFQTTAKPKTFVELQEIEVENIYIIAVLNCPGSGTSYKRDYRGLDSAILKLDLL